MKPLWLEAIGLAAPGLPTWTDARDVLRGAAPFVAAELPPYTPALLPANERRRVTSTVKLAFRAAEDAMRATSLPVAELATVFASSDGDFEMVHRIASGLAQPSPSISPTDFHNSVHNAPAGYFSIGIASRRPSSSIAAYDGSFAAGLLEAATLVTEDGADTLLAAYDIPGPTPLRAARAVATPFAVALVLTAAATPRSLARVTLALDTGAPTALPQPELEAVRVGNPAARCLPLLALIAAGAHGRVVLPGPGYALAADVAAP